MFNFFHSIGLGLIAIFAFIIPSHAPEATSTQAVVLEISQGGDTEVIATSTAKETTDYSDSESAVQVIKVPVIEFTPIFTAPIQATTSVEIQATTTPDFILKAQQQKIDNTNTEATEDAIQINDRSLETEINNLKADEVSYEQIASGTFGATTTTSIQAQELERQTEAEIIQLQAEIK